MCLATSAEAHHGAPSKHTDSSKHQIQRPRGPVLLFTLRDDCPARLGPEDLADPNRYHQRLKDWLLGQK